MYVHVCGAKFPKGIKFDDFSGLKHIETHGISHGIWGIHHLKKPPHGKPSMLGYPMPHGHLAFAPSPGFRTSKPSSKQSQVYPGLSTEWEQEKFIIH